MFDVTRLDPLTVRASGYITVHAVWMAKEEILDIVTTPRYTVKTWDSDLEEFTPHDAQSQNITLWKVRSVLRELRSLGYSCRRVRLPHGGYDSDPSVLVERVDEVREFPRGGG